ncbi:MAG: 4-hydroxy-3-methylbut-2-enyl diphosphate reductase [Candidatus Riflebacteria bacterium]|nr:4-hydroxy-3-methylbut-2-enyl diphosphate reductase [Candidatus Riflebacteria bacterium]
MPIIKLAKTSGFCMGVKRAMQIALETAKNSDSKVYTCGPLIHNPQAINFLKEQGVETSLDWHQIKEGTVIIRAHGMPKEEIAEIESKGLKTVDATCPHVKTSQKQIKKYSDLGYFIYIIGDHDHPEILSLQSFAKDFQVLGNIEAANAVSHKDKIMVISQTTFNAEEYKTISSILKEKADNVKICNSICQATSLRQNEIKELASEADAVIIVGGKSSANTRRLSQIASEICPNTKHVETEEELNPNDFKNCKIIAVSAGASTPDFITNKVIEYLEKL